MIILAAAFRRTVFAVCCAGGLVAQTTPAPGDLAKMHEFPVTMEQNIVAGTTPIGTKVRAKLTAATLMDGNVLPRNAVFFGEVIESVAKSKTTPARLAICMDSVQWKNGSADVKAYLTAWYYPTQVMPGDNLQYGPPQSAAKTWNGAGVYPDPNLRDYKPFPGGESNNQQGAPDTSAAVTSHHRIRMKNVDSVRGSDGRVSITSSRSNLKLDRLTTYVLATDDLSHR